MLDLEVWLIGTPAELDAAARTLSRIGRLVYHCNRIPLAGTDIGRYRTYARIRVAMMAAPKRRANPDDPPMLTDLAA